MTDNGLDYVGALCSWDDGGGGQATQTQTQSNAPWDVQAPYLEKGFEQAESEVLNKPPQYFAGDTFVPQSAETLQSLNTAQGLAQGSPLIDEAGNQLTNTLRGDYLQGGNPAYAAMAERAISPLRDEYTNTIRPGIDAGFIQGGRYGSGIARQNQQQMAADKYMRAVGDVGANLSYQDYMGERNLQNQAIGAAPGMYQQQFLPSQMMGQVGAAREAFSGQQLQDQINRFNFEQAAPAANLADYMGLVGGGYGGSSTTTTMTPQQQSNPWLTGLGAASTAAGIGGSLFGQNGIWPQ